MLHNGIQKGRVLKKWSPRSTIFFRIHYYLIKISNKSMVVKYNGNATL